MCLYAWSLKKESEERIDVFVPNGFCSYFGGKDYFGGYLASYGGD